MDISSLSALLIFLCLSYGHVNSRSVVIQNGMNQSPVYLMLVNLTELKFSFLYNHILPRQPKIKNYLCV